MHDVSIREVEYVIFFLVVGLTLLFLSFVACGGWSDTAADTGAGPSLAPVPLLVRVLSNLEPRTPGD